LEVLTKFKVEIVKEKLSVEIVKKLSVKIVICFNGGNELKIKNPLQGYVSFLSPLQGYVGFFKPLARLYKLLLNKFLLKLTS
jgi:hypothetical protein